MKNIFFIIALLNLLSCASTYLIQTKPEGAKVFFDDPKTEKKIYLGATPLNYSKQALPVDRAFSITITKEGFKSQTIPMAATDENRTVLNVSLKVDEDTVSPSSKELNEVVQKLFSIQEKIYSRKLHEAIVDLDELIKQKPQLVKAYIMKGSAYYLLNETNAAMTAWNIAYKLDPNDWELKKFLDDKRKPSSEEVTHEK